MVVKSRWVVDGWKVGFEGSGFFCVCVQMEMG